MNFLNNKLKDILDPNFAEDLEKELGLCTVSHLIYYKPYKYLYNGSLDVEKMPEEGARITTIVNIINIQSIPMKYKKGKLLKLVVKDENRELQVTFFNAAWMLRILKTGDQLLLSGTVKYFNNSLQLSHPSWIKIPKEGNFTEDITSSNSQITEIIKSKNPGRLSFEDLKKKIIPIYRGTKNIQTWQIWDALKIIFSNEISLLDIVDENFQKQNQLISTVDAIKEIHFPTSTAKINKAEKRLKFDEALSLLLIMREKRKALSSLKAITVPNHESSLEKIFLKNLKLSLTNGQKKVISEIAEDLSLGIPMNRLLQGEVGTGKTLVAFIAILRLISNNHQAIFVAPTEVLAKQHYTSIKQYLSLLEGDVNNKNTIKTVILTGNMTIKEKEIALLEIVSGEANIIIGTHALFSEKIIFQNLGFIVIDEQQRFGVEQRNALLKKGNFGKPHILFMTATPIPRSIALTMLGDMKVSTLKELPFGKRNIKTNVVSLSEHPKWLLRVWERAFEEIQSGNQVYFVCFRIDEKEAVKDKEIFSAEKLYNFLKAGPLSKVKLGLLHGKMEIEEKNSVMQKFQSGEFQALIATSVIEVGVDVAKANMISIMNAERFGISQLHQLRGRVGRKGQKGLCLLVTYAKKESEAFQRLEAISNEDDGFKLAELDLENRKEGDILGTMQSGRKSTLRFLSFTNDINLIDLSSEYIFHSKIDFSKKKYKEFIFQVLDVSQIQFLEKY